MSAHPSHDNARHPLGLVLLALLVASTSLTAHVSEADCSATVTVTSNADSGAGSLRQAIADVCGGGTITFDGDHAITLSSVLGIGTSMTIDGSDNSVTVDGNHAVRVFQFGSGVTLTLNHLTVANGVGADGFGGGVKNLQGTLVANSTFVGNSSTYRGGGLYCEFGNLNVTNTTFTGNSANTIGGGFSVHGGSAVARSCTFSGNQSQYGGAIHSAFVDIDMRNSLLASSTGGDCSNITSTGSNNLADDGTCGSGFTVSSSTLLGALGSYGGGTQTFPLLPGSAAIDGTSANCPATDQRGVARGATCDIGAFESQGFILALSFGDNQSTLVNTVFANPLQVGVIASGAGEPVSGGTVTFTGPSSGASTNPASFNVAVGADGLARATVTANAIVGGPYTVVASAAGAGENVSFSLTNLSAQPETVPALGTGGLILLGLLIALLAAAALRR